MLKAAEKDAKLGLLPTRRSTASQNVIKIGSPVSGIDVSCTSTKKARDRMLYSDGGITNTDDFADYKDVNGIKIAHKRVSAAAGRTTTYNLTKVEFDPKSKRTSSRSRAAP